MTTTTIGNNPLQQQQCPSLKAIIMTRGGAKEEEGDDEKKALVIVYKVSKYVVVTAGKVTVSTIKALGRALEAAFEKEEGDENDDETALTTVWKTIKRIWKAVLNPEQLDTTSSKPKSKQPKQDNDEQEEDDDEEENDDEVEEEHDFGNFLSHAYGVPDDRGIDKAIIMGGTLSDALEVARSRATLLLVFIPASRPDTKKKNKQQQQSLDEIAISSLLSQTVSDIVNKKTKGSSSSSSSSSSTKGANAAMMQKLMKQHPEMGSAFTIWSTRAGSYEATQAIQKLKAKQPTSYNTKHQQLGKKKKRPILLVAYPAAVLDKNNAGKIKVIPKVLAQHHCSPPPTMESMTAWLNALRKRHVKQYKTMWHTIIEAQFTKERSAGYRESIQLDVQRQEKAAREAEIEKKRREEQRQYEIMIQKRRQSFREALQEEEEPSKDLPGVITIALRFVNGQSGQRRFMGSTTTMQDLFHWIDAEFEMERETIILTTMNGKQTYPWPDEHDDEDDEEEEFLHQTLEDIGFGRMTGLRVLEKKKKPTNDENQQDNEDGDEDD